MKHGKRTENVVENWRDSPLRRITISPETMAIEYDRPTVVEAICERLANGESLAAICRDKNMPTTRCFLQWADEHGAVAAEYSRALVARAEWFNAEHDRIRKTAVDRESAAAARVQLAGLEWQMGRMAPKRYGERVDLNVEHSFDLANEINLRRQQVIEANERLGIAPPEGSK